MTTEQEERFAKKVAKEYQLSLPTYSAVIHEERQKSSLHGCKLWLLSLTSTFLAVLLLTRLLIYSADQAAHTSIIVTTNTDNATNEIITRASWSEHSGRSVFCLPHPTPYVVIAHSGGHPCYNQSECIEVLRELQKVHMFTLHEPEIGWNFFIGGDGKVYEGRGWDSASFVLGFMKKRSLGICFLGNYVESRPTAEQLTALQQVLQSGRRLEKLAPYYKLIAHSQIVNTSSPGENILNEINTWSQRCLHNCWAKK